MSFLFHERSWAAPYGTPAMITVKDYDCEGVDDGQLKTDEHGESYVISEWNLQQNKKD